MNGMKTKILMVVALLFLSGWIFAQPAEKGGRNPKLLRAQDLLERAQKSPGKGLDLTDAQKEAFKQISIAIRKQIRPLHNELGEAKARQKSLMEADKPDMGAINKNIEKMGALHVEIAKIQAKHRLEMRAQLTDEQKLKFDLRKRTMKMKHGTEE